MLSGAMKLLLHHHGFTTVIAAFFLSARTRPCLHVHFRSAFDTQRTNSGTLEGIILPRLIVTAPWTIQVGHLQSLAPPQKTQLKHL